MKISKRFSLMLIPAIFAAVLVFVACNDTTTTPSDDSEISGQITDEQNVGVPNAIVQLNTAGVSTAELVACDTTDEDGNFSFSKITSDLESLNLKVFHQDFEPYTLSLKEYKNGHHNFHGMPVRMRHDDTCSGILEINTYKFTDSTTLGGVEIRLKRNNDLVRKTKTDDQGYFKFEHVCAYTYTYRIAKEGYEVIEGTVTIDVSVPTSLVFYLKEKTVDSCCNGVIKLEVTDSLKQTPLEKALVKLWKGNDCISSVYTNDYGVYTFRQICEGDYGISIHKDKYFFQEFTFHVGCNDSVFIKKALLSSDSCCDGVANIYVKDSIYNSAISGATVKIWKNGTLLTTLSTNDNGLASFTGLCMGKYGFDIITNDYAHQEFALEITCNETKNVTKYLKSKSPEDSCCKGTLKVYAKDTANGEALSGATVKLWKGSTLLTTLTIGDAGYAYFSGLCAGTYSVSVMKPHYRGKEFSVSYVCNEVYEKEILLKSELDQDTCCKGFLKVYAKDTANGEVLSGATVKLWKGGALLTTLTIGDAGYAYFSGLCAGTYSVSVMKPHYRGKEFSVSYVCNEIYEKEILLKSELDQDTCCKGIVKVWVKDSSSNEALNGATVKLWKDGKVYRTNTVKNGVAGFDGLCEGSYGVSVLFEHYNSIEFTLQLGCNATYETTKMLSKKNDTCSSAILKLKILDKNTSEPINEAIVDIYLHDSKIKTVYSNAEGWAIAESLSAPATYVVRINKDGYSEKAVTFSYSTCKTLSETIRLETK